MGEVVRFRRRRQFRTVRGFARQALTEAMHGDLSAVVIVALKKDGTFSVRSVNDQAEIQDFDMYARAAAVIEREKRDLID